MRGELVRSSYPTQNCWSESRVIFLLVILQLFVYVSSLCSQTQDLVGSEMLNPGGQVRFIVKWYCSISPNFEHCPSSLISALIAPPECAVIAEIIISSKTQ